MELWREESFWRYSEEVEVGGGRWEVGDGRKEVRGRVEDLYNGPAIPFLFD